MPKVKLNKRYTTEFKIMAVETYPVNPPSSIQIVSKMLK